MDNKDAQYVEPDDHFKDQNPKPFGTARDKLVFIGYIILFIALIVADVFYKDQLFTLNNEVMPAVQKALPMWIIEYFKMMTLLGYGAAGVTMFMLFYIFSTRDKAFYILLVHTIESLFN